MNRDVFKSDSCILEIPEVDFSMASGSLGSHYTTVEGLLDKVRFEYFYYDIDHNKSRGK